VGSLSALWVSHGTLPQRAWMVSNGSRAPIVEDVPTVRTRSEICRRRRPALTSLVDALIVRVQLESDLVQ
jgi:hypothetical protein